MNTYAFNSRHHRLAFLLVVPAILLLTGCGTRPTPLALPPAPFEEVAPSPTAIASTTPLQVLGHFRDEDEPRIRAITQRFSEKSGIEVEYEGTQDVAERLKERLESGQVPDIILLPVPGWLVELASAGAVPPLAPDAAEAVHTNFAPVWQEMVSYEGAVYGVPFDANAKSLLWYRPSQVADVTATEPESYEELLALAEQFASQGQSTFAVTGGAGWTLTDWFESVLLASAGTGVYDDLVHHRIAWTDSAIEEAARKFVALLRDDTLMGGNEGAASLPLIPETFREAFNASDPGALLWLGQRTIAQGRLPGLDTRGGAYNLFPFPAEGAIIGTGSVATGTNTRQATTEFLTYLTQPDAVDAWIQEGDFISPNRAIPLEHYPNALARHEAELLVDAPLFQYDLSDRLPPRLATFFEEQLREMLLNPQAYKTILEAIEQVATQEQGSPLSEATS